MKRSGPPQRKTPLRPKSPWAKGRPRRIAVWEKQAIHDAVRRRSHGVCELCGNYPASELHHRRMRSAGGADIAENILDLCRSCHHVTIHGNPDWAYRHGLLLRRGGTDHPDPIIGCPLDCPVDHLD